MLHKRAVFEDAIRKIKARTYEERIEIAQALLEDPEYSGYRDVLLADLERYEEEAYAERLQREKEEASEDVLERARRVLNEPMTQ